MKSRLPLLFVVALVTAPGLASGQSYFQDEEEDLQLIDEDIQLLDTHIAMHTGANIGAGAFGTVSIIMGVDQFVKRDLFSGLTFSLWGAATLISSATSSESALRQWSAVRPALMASSETERRLYRTQQADRLTRMAINRAIGLAADGASLGIGIALLVAPGQGASPTQGLATSLVFNGAFLLGIDAFRTGVDDQVARQWRARNESADRGYFSMRAPRHRGIAGVSLFGQPTTSSKPGLMPGDSTPVWVPGGVLGITAVY